MSKCVSAGYEGSAMKTCFGKTKRYLNIIPTSVQNLLLLSYCFNLVILSSTSNHLMSASRPPQWCRTYPSFHHNLFCQKVQKNLIPPLTLSPCACVALLLSALFSLALKTSSPSCLHLALLLWYHTPPPPLNVTLRAPALTSLKSCPLLRLTIQQKQQQA